jgi:serine-type D-Ala-D-Ala carboxypeptidase (penicillin-binding protein 5/6)
MQRVRRRSVIPVVVISLVLIGVITFVLVALLRTVPPASLAPAPLPRAFPGHLSRLAWPAAGESALAVQGVGLVGARGGDQPLAIASVAKIMTAYIVLRDHPLHPGEDGPAITITPADVAVYKSDLALGQSVAEVKAGEVLTERQALEALLLPSANNVATLLAEWDAGSEPAFVAKMNAVVRRMGLSDTHYVDASGFNSATVSTARDQVRLASAAIRLPAFAHIVATREVVLPVAGLEHNLDGLLGSDGIVGIKTGTTNSAGGCFVLAARIRVGGRRVTVVGAVLGQPAGAAAPTILDAALHAAGALAKSVPHTLKPFGTLVRGRTLARVRTAWGTTVPVRAARIPRLVGWPGLPVSIKIVPQPRLIAPLARGQQVGYALVRAGRQRTRLALVATRAVALPSVGWRLSHP